MSGNQLWGQQRWDAATAGQLIPQLEIEQGASSNQVQVNVQFQNSDGVDAGPALFYAYLSETADGVPSFPLVHVPSGGFDVGAVGEAIVDIVTDSMLFSGTDANGAATFTITDSGHHNYYFCLAALFGLPTISRQIVTTDYGPQAQLGMIGAIALSAAHGVASFTTLGFIEAIAQTVAVANYAQPSKDCTALTLAVPPVPDNNLNGQELTVSSIVLSSSDAYLGWPANQLPVGLTISAAVLRLVVQTTQVGDCVIDIYGIANGGETWDETTINDANRPARSGGSKQQFTVADTTPAGTVITVTLNSTVRSYLQAKIAAALGSMTLVLGTASTTVACVFYDKEDVAAHPALLQITF